MHRRRDHLRPAGAELVERHRADATKARTYPDPHNPLRVRDERLLERREGMVAHFASTNGVADDATSRRKATEEFYHFYLEMISERRPSSHNSHTGWRRAWETGRS